MNDAIAKQGIGDGLCGIYCLANSMIGWEKINDFPIPLREAIRRLVVSAERLNLLDSYHVTVGFEDFELCEIFNLMAENYRYANIAIPLEVVAKEFQLTSAIGIVREIIAVGGAVIVSVEKGEHWVLAQKIHEDEKSVKVIDSWPGSKLEKIGQIQTLKDGVVIIGRESELAKLKK